MSKYSAGLHKDVAAIFSGVSLPINDGAQQPPPAPGAGHQDYSAPKPSVAEPSSAPEPPAPKSPVPSHMVPTKPKPEQPPAQSPPKAPQAKKTKAKTAKKDAGQKPWLKSLVKVKEKLLAQKPGERTTTKQKVMMVLVPVLFGVLIFMFIPVFSSPAGKGRARGPKGSKAGPVKATVAASEKKLDWQIPAPYPTELRDPMQFSPGAAEGGQAGVGGLTVKGIVFSANPCAVIGDEIVHEGDKVLGVVIVKINEDSVDFEVNGKKWTQKVQR